MLSFGISFMRMVLITLFAAALTSCETVTDSVNRSLSQMQVAASAEPKTTPQAAMRPTGTKSPIGSELDGLFTRNPITNNQKPETFPRAAITIKSASRGMLTPIMGGVQINPSLCMVFSIVVWRNPTQSTAFDDVSVCVDDLNRRAQNVAFADVAMWALGVHFPHVQTTGQLRTTGPNPPTNLTPTDALSRRYFDQFNHSIYFTGGLLHIMGYNWQDRSDKRVWFVSVPPPQ